MRVVRRDRLAGTRIDSAELDRWHRAAASAGETLAEFLRAAARKYVREIECEQCEAQPHREAT
jgi:hypothetical protein